MTNPILVDSHGRQMRKLRVSLTDHCNYRCFYCMPADARFFKRTEMLSPEQYQKIVKALLDLGIEEIRLTGGEPTVSPLFREIVQHIAELNPLKLALTSNGELLEPHLQFLKQNNVNSLNISLDSLQAERFAAITRGGQFDKVMSTLLQAIQLEFDLKINCVLMRGHNDDEIIDFVKFSEEHSVEVRFLEVMKIGPRCEDLSSLLFPQKELMELISLYTSLQEIPQSRDSTSKVYQTQRGGRIGFISSETQPFCNQCSRLRLTSKGALRGCLFKADEVSLIDKEGDELYRCLHEAIALKPFHRIDHFSESMHITGG